MKIEWVEDFSIKVKIDGNSAVISANREGLQSLSAICSMLADQPPGSHVHLDEGNSLENASAELIISVSKVKKMKSILIKDTTREERERIVADSIGNINGSCDGCATGLVEMYQDYIDGKKEIRDINMDFVRDKI